MQPTEIPRGQLWTALIEQSRRAIAAGALHTIRTQLTPVEQEGIVFAVRVAENLHRKAAAKRESAADFNPFLPPEPELTVGALGPDHLAVLNKFNVVDHHLLIITRAFEPQERLLTPADFAVLWRCLGEYDGLGFYNGGTVAGASQRHKHLQLIPLPLQPGGPLLPIEPLLAREGVPNEIGQSKALPYVHRITALPDPLGQPGETLEALYRKMLAALGVPAQRRDDGWWQSGPYNLLLTRRWMLVVPRRQECAEGVSINAMGFAGSLFVRDAEALERVVTVGPARILEAVSGPREPG